MGRALNILIVEDSDSDARMLAHRLESSGYGVTFERVETADEMDAALAHRVWDLVLADYTLPRFSAPRALDLLRDRAPDLPCIVVSGTVGEQVAVETMQQGAADYLLKDRLARFGAAVEHALEARALHEQTRRADRALRETQAFLEQAQEIAQVGSWISDLAPAARLVWSREVFRIFGLSETGFDGTVATFFARVHPDDLEAVHNARRLAAERATDYEIEHRILRPDGEVRWVHEKARVLRDDAGQPVRLLGVVQDITERKQAEAALTQERNLLRTLIDTHPDLIYVKDTASRFVIVNPALTRSLGKPTASDIIGKSDQDFHPADRAAQFRADEQRVLETGQPLIDREDFILGPDGDTRCVLSTKVPLRDGHGTIIGLVGVGRDITDRKQAEEALNRQNEELTRFNRAAVGRELRMIELKQQVNDLARQLGQPAPYSLTFLDAPAPASLPSADAATAGSRPDPASTSSP